MSFEYRIVFYKFILMIQICFFLDNKIYIMNELLLNINFKNNLVNSAFNYII